MRGTFVGALVAVSLGAARDAKAADLLWNSPDSCQRVEAVSEQVEALIRRPLAQVEALQFELTVRQNGEAWHVELTTRTNPADAPHQRTLNGRSCAEVTDAAAVVIAMAVQDAAREQEREAAEHDEAPGPIEQPEPLKETTARPVPPATKGAAKVASGSYITGLFALGALADSAALPGGSLGVSVDAGFRYAVLRLALEGSAWVPRTLDLGAGRSAEFSLIAGAALACVEHEVGPVLGLGCGGFELGRLAGEGSGITDPRLGSATWQALRVDVGAAYPSRRALRFSGRFGAAVPLTRPVFQLDQKDVYRTATLGARLWLGLEISP
ncbi:MAG: hypothetical protein QM756_04740 [Polyangiaceae bacterium]